MQRLVQRYLVPSLDGFRVRGSLLFQPPDGYLLRAFKFESSAFSGSTFHVQAFVLPLYVPTEHLYFTFGDRLGRGGVSWDVEKQPEPAAMAEVLQLIEREGLPLLNGAKEPMDLFAVCQSLKLPLDDPRIAEALTYARVLGGQHAEALLELDDLLPRTAELEARAPWAREIRLREQVVADALRRAPAEALAHLKSWRAESCARLKIDCAALL
jgi:hypothetical protein